MRVLAVDDEALMLKRLCRCIQEAEPKAEITSFRWADEAFEYVKTQRVDVAFLDIQMCEMDGMELAKKMKLVQPEINIVFCTGYSEYMYDAISEVRCSGYILKPVTTEQIRKELDNLRNPIKRRKEKQVYIQCFGNFEIFVNGKALLFEVAKAKELLAYLVDRNGAVCQNREISAALWEDDADHSSYLKKCKKCLVSTLTVAGCADLIVSRWGSMGIDREKFSCDYYDWLAGMADGINAYHGQYMAQYSWGEITNAGLNNNQ